MQNEEIKELKLRLSRQSSVTNSIVEEASPDLSDLYKRFENINPPDLIAQTRPSSTSHEGGLVEAKITEEDKEKEVADDEDIELPEHLRKLVETARAQIEQEEQCQNTENL